MTKGKIVLVPFPFDDLSATKARPALCLTDAIGEHQHIVVAFISSRVPSAPLDSDFTVLADEEGFAQTGLKVSSVVRLHRLMTIAVSTINRELGALPTAHASKINDRLRQLFQL